MQNIKLAIVGNGKLAKSLVKGLLLSGTLPSEIFVVGSRETSDLSYFESVCVPNSRNIMDVKKAECVILAVTPTGIGSQLKRLREVEIKEIISISSGTNVECFSRFLKIPKVSIVSGTLNTNVEYCKGLIYLSGAHRSGILRKAKVIFEKLGKVFLESPNNIRRSIVIIGSMNAFDALSLLIAFKKETENKDISLEDWLKDIYVWFLIRKDYAYRDDDSHIELQSYLQNKSVILSVDFKCRYAKDITIRTFKSTLLSLLLIKDITVSDIEAHIRNVATEGGCTEKGLLMINNPSDLISCDKLRGALMPVYERAKQFEKDAIDSFSN
jgi:pyrroline-5-carboxylate reductase